jgi:DNA-binding NtrC family response regulator
MITMGPFIEQYINGNVLGIALDEFILKNPFHQLALAMKKMHMAIANINYFDEANEMANLVDYKKYEVEEQLIFLKFLAHLYISKERYDNAKSILSTTKRLITPQLSAEMQIIPIDIEASIHRSQGSFSKQIILLEQSMQILNEKSGSFKLNLWVYLVQLVILNYHDKFNKHFDQFVTIVKNTNLAKRIDYILLLKNVEQGNFEAIPSYVKNVREDKTLKFCENNLVVCEKIYQIFVKNNMDTLDENFHVDWYLYSFAYLHRNQPEKALFWAHKFANLYTDYKLESSFISYFLIRAELANKNINAAEYSLENKKKIGNTCIYDDFFWFRIHHIKGDTDGAQYYFNLFSESVGNQKLDKRFDVELKLSPEISYTDIRNYTKKMYTSSSAVFQIKKPINDNKDAINFIIGDSLPIQKIKELIHKFASIETLVLINGETGTGKELIAKALWQTGPYQNKPFIPINCGAISEHLLQSELFGHKKGAFTGAFSDHQGIFEAADDGVVFMDEIGEIKSNMQINLLRLLEAKEFRPVGSNTTKQLKCKIIAATNKKLETLVKEGTFREDLQYRLERLVIEVPPLRNRPTDIPILIEYFLNDQNKNLPKIFFDKQTLAHLCTLPWKGNIRELRNEMERIRLFYSDKNKLTLSEISEKYKTLAPALNSTKQEPLSEPPQINLNSKFRKLENLKKLFNDYPQLSRLEVSSLVNVSANTAANYLNTLAAENFIQKCSTQNSKTIYYVKTKDQR